MESQGRGRGRGERGRCREDRDTRLSKSMTFALRHGAFKLGLHLNPDGFLFVEDLLAHPQFRSYTLEDVERVVAINDKKRFKLCRHPEDGRWQIRANQGHSLQVPDLELRPVLASSPDCPVEGLHRSYLCHWTSIRTKGLSRMGRTHIHMCVPGEEEVPSGRRDHCDLCIYIDVPKALAGGIQFFRSDNGVLLTPGDTEGKLPLKYFSKAVSLKPTRRNLPLE